jgi:hypothetical protein
VEFQSVTFVGLLGNLQVAVDKIVMVAGSMPRHKHALEISVVWVSCLRQVGVGDGAGGLEKVIGKSALPAPIVAIFLAHFRLGSEM